MWKMIAFLPLRIVFVLCIVSNNLSLTAAIKLSHCSKGADSYGAWLNTGDVTDSEEKLSEFGNHFLDSEPGEALEFSQVWQPNNCSYHRFTKESLETVVDHVLSAKHASKRPKSDQVHLLFMTDSGTRGQLCGIIRMIQGTEVYGPTENIICGSGPGHLARRTPNELVNMTFFDNRLVIHFSYTGAFIASNDPLPKLMLDNAMNIKPYAFVFNTGKHCCNKLHLKILAVKFHMLILLGWWSYVLLNVAQNWTLFDPPGPCSNAAYFNVSESRGSPAINKTLWEVSDYAKQEHIQLIYRNSHYNFLYDPECADRKVEENIRGKRPCVTIIFINSHSVTLLHRKPLAGL